MNRQLSAIREIEKAGGTIWCSVRAGEHVVTVTMPSGLVVRHANNDRYDFAAVLETREMANEATGRLRTGRAARTRVVTPLGRPAPHTANAALQEHTKRGAA